MGLPLRIPLGLLLCGYGTLVLVGVMPHDAPWAGAVALLAGLLLLSLGLQHLPKIQAGQDSDLPRRRLWVAGLGATLVVGVLLYNIIRRSGLGLPEWGILGYGALLMAASPRLDRRFGGTTVANIVGWSFPLLLAPLALFALNAAISSGAGETAASPLVQLFVVQPTAAGLRLTGLPVQVTGSTLLVPTPRGNLSLGVGLVCAGLYPMVLFAGLAAMHVWTERIGWRKSALLVGAGILGLWVLNLIRLVALARVGVAWGPSALQSAHANLGWILFALYMVLFWSVALRRKPASSPA